MYVKKRDGRFVEFDERRIVKAVTAAFLEVDGEISVYAIEKANNIANHIKSIAEKQVLDIERIQDLVERGLMSTKRKDVARAYIVFRDKKARRRNDKSTLLRTLLEKISADNVQNQNANVDEHSFGGRMGEATDAMMKDLALTYFMSEMSRQNHLNNQIYIHDLGSYPVGMHNCLSVPFDDLLANGFKVKQTDVRPANSINTAFQLIAVVFQIQSLMQYGGVSATHLDWTMVPYIRKSFYKHWKNACKYIPEQPEDPSLGYINGRAVSSNASIEDIRYKNYPLRYEYTMDMTIKETEQAVEGMYHNLNTLQSRSGNQLPFTSLNYGTCTLPEGRIVIKALLEGSLKGVGKMHRTPIFPCGIFQCMKGVNRKPGDPNYDLFELACQSTAKRLYPNYANVDWSGNEGYDRNDPRTYFSTMGCRTANGWDVNGLGQLKDGRGNIAPVTIILPTLAMEAAHYYDDKPCGDIEEDTIDFFMQILDTKIHEAKDMLIERFEWICSQSAESARFMYENNTMAGYIPEEGIRSALKHGTLAVGQIGLAETLQILIGKNHTTPEGMALAKRIEQLFKDRCAEFKEQYKLNFGVYFTPAENLCFTAMTKFKKQYGEIPNVSDKKFFTNSIHVPVWEQISPIEKINIESQLTGYSSAGCITYVEMDQCAIHNYKAIETLVNYAMDKDIPYFALNFPNDTCLSCGYTGEIDGTCPACGSDEYEELRRVTGYLTGDYRSSFNEGKQQEVQLRYQHSKKGLNDEE